MIRVRAVSLMSSLLLVAAPLSAQTVVVNGSGSMFTNAGPSNADDASCSAVMDAWCARNVRLGGAAGATTANARNGNGSLQFVGPNQAKADFEYRFSAGNQFKIKDLTSLSYDWFRNSSSTVAGHLHPAIRLLVAGPNAAYVDALIYERAYNPPGPLPTLPTNTWVTENITGNTFLWWNKGGCANPDFSVTLADWADGHLGCTQDILDNTMVVGFSVGVGSGWTGQFDGAVDNVSFQLAGQNQAKTFNFEVASQSVVPEPSTYALMGLGLAAVGVVARRRRSGQA